MNLTLSADEDLVRRMRALAARKGTSLNKMVREYMEEATGSGDLDGRADEFVRLATEHSGSSPEGFTFDREEAHRRNR